MVQRVTPNAASTKVFARRAVCSLAQGALLGVACLGLGACTARDLMGFAPGSQQIPIREHHHPFAGRRLIIVGGPHHRVFLGCLNCGPGAADSVNNHFGKYGSYWSKTSINNHRGPYGAPTSRYSACSTGASQPPLVMDQMGRVYGYLTLNTMHPGIIRYKPMLAWLAGTCCGL